ncbi:acyl-CoA desaturase [Haloechinothrix sp. LS1_15]|uniref:fatty acid desaturase family protein n=1 Tax=Haloechinothrix sp. LS1_15 TaxID=2652248 RepID=UPI0029458FA4|nr:acyl-CoA desaturase [Haloechinothrix sp. LS1_15]MDV6011137.1 acyl-CoA desaturase [Haloechinothrix sp. LS1_15]
MSHTSSPEATPRMGSSDFTELSRRIREAGLLAHRPGYYTARIAVVTTALVAAWAVFALFGQTWWPLIAVVLAALSGQVALLAHDIAHRQVFPSRRSAEIAGLLFGNLTLGMSYGWWMRKHTRHHANPNHEDLDPDVAPAVLVWSRRQATRSSGLPRFVGRWQAYLFLPLLTLEGLNLHVASVRAVLEPGMRRRGLEAGLLLAHFAGYLAVVGTVLPLPQAIAFVAVHKALWGVYLGVIFAPNHKGMPEPESSDFLRKQVCTTRNVRGGRLTDLALGGLNHQIEHHLFPSMPTPNLRAARPLVRDHCARLGISYHEVGLLRSWQEALRHLHDAGAPLREVGTAPPGEGR